VYHLQKGGGNVAKISAKSTLRYGVPLAPTVDMRYAITVPTYLLQQDRCSEIPVDEFAARTHNTHNMQETRPTTPESIRDGGYVAKISGRLIPSHGEITALIVVIKSVCPAQHCDEYHAPGNYRFRRQALKSPHSSQY
jgi:hypothetical protein